MRTRITGPDELTREGRDPNKERPPSERIRTALHDKVDRLKAECLVRELEEGYRSEAQDPSLDPAWTRIHPEGL